MATNLDVIGILKKELDLSSVFTVLDLGCGSFQNTSWDYKELDILLNMFAGKDITGVDIYAPNIQWRNKYGPPGNYICADIMDFDFSEKHDIVICHHVLEHLTIEEHDYILNKIESNFKKYSILGGPVGYHDNTYHVNQTGNPNEKHQIGLDPLVYEKLGYKMFYVEPVFIAIKKR